MSLDNNSYLRAQRAYDRQLPPEIAQIECPECEGEGTIPVSSCCESEIRNGHCMECGSNTVHAKCSTCDGAGVVTVPEHIPEPDREG